MRRLDRIKLLSDLNLTARNHPLSQDAGRGSGLTEVNGRPLNLSCGACVAGHLWDALAERETFRHGSCCGSKRAFNADCVRDSL